MRNLDLKTRNKSVILGAVFGSVLLVFGATVFFIPNAYATNNTETIGGLATNNTETIGGLATTVDLGTPFFIQQYRHDVEPLQSEEPRLYVNHTNRGIINGNLWVTHVGNTTETLIGNNTVYLTGFRNLTSDNGMDYAHYDFYAIGNYHPDNTYTSNGVAIFDEVATGRLSFLANAVAIYKVKVDADGNGAFLMWQLR
jgi:hypothetical protein